MEHFMALFQKTLNKLTRLSAIKLSVSPGFSKPYIVFETSLCSFKTWKMLLSVPFLNTQFSLVVQLCPTLRPYGQKHASPPCPSPTPGVYSNSCPLSWWCHPTISSSVVPFYSRLQSFLASGSFPLSQFFESGGQSIGISASASVLPLNIQDWSPLGWTGWISLQSKELSTVFFNTTVQKHQFFSAQLSL